MADAVTAHAAESGLETVRFQLFKECEAMASYALGIGMILPETVCQDLGLIAGGYNNSPSTDDTTELALLHSQLAQLVRPAKPNTLRLLQDERVLHPAWRVLGPLPSVRRLVSAAFMFGVLFMATSLSPAINRTILREDIYSTSGIELLIVLTFLLSAAGLGACFNVLYAISQSISEGNYDPRGESLSWMSIALGLMAGLLLCELIPVELGGGTNTLVKPVIALLGGFSASLLHRVLGRMVETVGNLFEASSAERMRLQEQELRLRAIDQSRQERVQVTSTLVDALGRVRDGGSAQDAEGAIRSALDRLDGRPAVRSSRLPVQRPSDIRPEKPEASPPARPESWPHSVRSVGDAFISARSAEGTPSPVTPIPVREASGSRNVPPATPVFMGAAAGGRRQRSGRPGAMTEVLAADCNSEATLHVLRPAPAVASEEELDALRQKVAERLLVLDIVIEMAPADTGVPWSGLRAEIKATWSDLEQQFVGNPVEASRLGEQLTDILEKADPIRDTINAANIAFDAVLQTSSSARALAEGLAEAAAQLDGTAFKRLVARLLHAPYTPDLVGVAHVSDTEAMAALAATSWLKQVYAPEDVEFISHLAREAIEGHIDELWDAESRRFDNLEHFVDAIAEYQLALLDQIVRSELPRETAARFKGVDRLLSTIDALRANPDSHVELDRMVTLISELRWHGLDVVRLIRTATVE